MERQGIYKKLANVMKGVEKIPKNGVNQHFNYKFVQEADLTEHIRKLLIKEGLVMIPTVNNIWRDVGDKRIMTRVHVTYRIVDVDSGEKIHTDWYGESLDAGDKGIYKAYTGAGKYMMMKTFLIVSGDDPEEDGPPKKSAEKKEGEKATPKEKALRQMFATAKEKFDAEAETMLHDFIETLWGLDSIKKLTMAQIGIVNNWLRNKWETPIEEAVKFYKDGK